MEDEPKVKHPEVAAIFTRLLAELRVSAGGLANSIEPRTTQQAIQTYTSGKSKPGWDLLSSIMKRYPALNSVWLLTGEGEPFPNGKYGKGDTFFVGAKKSVHGSDRIAAGALDAQFPNGLTEDVDGGAPAKKLPTNAPEFIKDLLAEIEDWKKTVHNKDQIILELRSALDESREALKESRINAQFLREQLSAKDEGSQFAPVAYAAEPTAPYKPVQGFGRRTDARGPAKVIAMWPAPLALEQAA